MKTKICSRCGKEKLYSEFDKQKGVRYKDDIRPWCRDCYREYAAERYKKESNDKYASVVCSDSDGNTYYTDEYVEWLEDLVKKFNISGVGVPKGTLCECGGNERVALDCTSKACKHPKYCKE